MSDDAQKQKYRDAAKAMPKDMLKDRFGSTGIDLVETDSPVLKTALTNETPKAADAGARAVLGGFNDNEGGGEKIRNTLYGLMTGSGDNSSVMRNNMTTNTDNGMGGSAGKENERKRQEQLDALIRQLAFLNAQIADLDRRINDNNKKIEDNNLEIAKSEAFDQRLDGYIKDLEHGKLPEKNADGTFKDQELEAKIKEYEKKYGKIDHNDARAVLEVVFKIKEDERKHREQWARDNDRMRSENDGLQKQKTDFEKQRDERKEEIKNGFGQEILDKVEAGNHAALNQTQSVTIGQIEEMSFDDDSAPSAVAVNTSVASEVDAGGVNVAKITNSFNAARNPNSEVAANPALTNKLNPVV